MPLPRPAPGTAKWWVVGTVGCVAGTALAIWWGLASTVGQVTWTDLGYEHATDRSITVMYDVHRPVGHDVSCVVQALDNRHGRGRRPTTWRCREPGGEVARRRPSVGAPAGAVT